MSVSAFIEILNGNLEHISNFIASVLGYIGISIILYGFLKGIFEFIFGLFNKGKHIPHIRIEIEKHLLLGLEFLVGKDVIGTIVNPSWDELGKLGAIILIRTFISVFLDYELNSIQKRYPDANILK